MIRLDEDALICDLAETYHIYDYRSLPLKTVATLSAGLRENSRIRLLAAEAPATQEVVLLATIADRIEWFRYGFSKDAEKGRNKPISIVDSLFKQEDKETVRGFETAAELEAALARFREE